MKVLLPVLCFACVVSLSSSVAPNEDIYQEARDNAEKCKETCKKEFPAEKFSESSHVEGCERGCRFFSMGKIVHARAGGSIQENCHNACHKAYSGADSKPLLNSCKHGCKSQIQIPANPFEQIEKEMMQEMKSAMSDDWPWSMMRSFFSAGEDSKGFQDQGFIQKLLDQQSEAEAGKGVDGIRLVVISTSENLPQKERIQPMEGIEDENEWGLPYYPVVPKRQHTARETDQNRRWFDCHGGIPRWLLLSAMFMCSLIFIWLCFTVSGTRSANASQGNNGPTIVDADEAVLAPLPLDKDAQLTLWETGIKDGGLPAVPLLYSPPQSPSKEAPPPYTSTVSA